MSGTSPLSTSTPLSTASTIPAEQLGYVVQRRIARVQPHRAGPRTHMMLAVGADGVDYLVDVGFGAGMLYPMPPSPRRRRAHRGVQRSFRLAYAEVDSDLVLLALHFFFKKSQVARRDFDLAVDRLKEWLQDGDARPRQSVS